MNLKKKKYGSKGKILRKILIFKKIFWKVLTDILTKTSQNIFAYSFISEHSKHFFYFEKKTYIFVRRRGGGGGGGGGVASTARVFLTWSQSSYN